MKTLNTILNLTEVLPSIDGNPRNTMCILNHHIQEYLIPSTTDAEKGF